MRLCHSRMMFVRAYPRETQEMVFRCHERALRAVQGCLHTWHLRQHEDGGGDESSLVKTGNTTAAFCRCVPIIWWILSRCTPASGWEKVRSRTRSVWCASASLPEAAVKTYDELNAWLTDNACLRQGTSASRTSPSRRCGTSSRRNGEAGRLSWPLRWFHALPASVVEDLPGAASTTTNTR